MAGNVKQWLTIFKGDDITTVDGVVAADPPTPAQATCSTDPAHARPYLYFDEQGADREVKLTEGVVSIGAAQIRIQDARRTSDQRTGWLTQLLADSGGSPQLQGRRLVLTQQDLYSGPYVVWDQTIYDIKLEDNDVDYLLSLRDIRERERDQPLFIKADSAVVFPFPKDTGTSVYNIATKDGYGRIVPGDPNSQLLIQPAKGAKGTYHQYPAGVPTGFVGYNWPGGIPVGHIQLDKQFELKSADYDALLAPYNLAEQLFFPPVNFWDPTTLALHIGMDTGVRTTGMVLDWRAWGSSGAWTEVRNFPEYWGNPYDPGWAINSTHFENSIATYKIGELVVAALTFAELPTDGQVIEFRVRSGLPPTEAAPFYFEGTIATFLTNYFNGIYSEFPLNLRPDPAAIALMTEWIRIIKTSSEPKGQDWLNEHIYKTWGYLPIINKSGRFSPIKQQLPTSAATLINLTDANCRNARWHMGLDDAVTAVTFAYQRDYVDQGHQLQTVQVQVDDINAPGSVLAGDHPVDFKPETVRDVTTDPNGSYGKADTNDNGYKLAKRRQYELIDRFGLGGQHYGVDAFRSDASIRAAKEGDWCVVQTSNLPDLATRLRGPYRLAQITEIKDHDPTVRTLHLIDAGPHSGVLSVPTVVSASLTGDMLQVKVTIPDAGASGHMDYAITSTNVQPGATDPRWQFGDRQVGNAALQTQIPIIANSYVWYRVRSESASRPSSAWVTSGTSIVASAPLVIINPELLIDLAGLVTTNYQVPAGVNGVRLYYQTTAVGVDANSPPSDGVLDYAAGQAQPINLTTLSAGSRLTIAWQAWSGWTGTAVSGTSGLVTGSKLVERPAVVTNIGPPEARISYASGTAVDETVQLDALLGTGSPGPIQWQYQVGGAAFSTLTTGGLPTNITISRNPVKSKAVTLRVVQPDGQTSQTTYIVVGQLPAVDSTTGKNLRGQLWDDGGYSVPASSSDGLTMTAGVKESGGKTVNRLFGKPLSSSPDDAGSVPAGSGWRIPLSGATDGSGNVDLGGTAWINRYSTNITRSSGDGTALSTIIGNLANTGHAGAGMQESGGKTINRLFGKPTSGTPDDAGAIPAGSGWRIPLSGVTDASGNADLAGTAWINRYSGNIKRSAGDLTGVDAIIQHLQNSGHADGTMQESGGKLISRLFGKPTSGAADDAGSIPAGSGWRIPLSGATDGSGNIDLSGSAWVNKDIDHMPDGVMIIRTPQMTGGDNMAENANFEATPNAGVAVPGYFGNSATISLDATAPHSGTKSLKVATSAQYGSATALRRWKIVPGEVITVFGWIKGLIAADNPDIQLQFINAAGGYISGVQAAQSNVTAWTSVSDRQVAPAGTVYGVLTLQNNNASPGTVWFDDILVLRERQASEVNRGGGDTTQLGTIIGNITNSGHASAPMQESGGKTINRLFGKPTSGTPDDASAIPRGSGFGIPLSGATDGSGNIDLGGTAWINRYSTNITRSSSSSDNLGNVVQQLSSTGNANSGMTESGGKAINRLLGKAVAGDSDTLDGVPEGTTYRRINATNVTSGNVDLGAAAVLGKYTGNLVRSSGDATALSTIIANVTNSGHAAAAMQESGGKAINRLFGKPLSSSPDSLDSVGDGASYAKIALSRVNGGRPIIDFTETIHSNKNLDNIADGGTYQRPTFNQVTGGGRGYTTISPGGEVFLGGSGTSSTQKVNIGTQSTPAAMQRIYRIPFADFSPQTNAITYTKTGGRLRPGTVNVQADFVAGLTLPLGATIISFGVRSYRGTTSDVANASIGKETDGSISTLVSANHATTGWSSPSTGLSEVVSSGVDVYLVSVTLQGVAAVANAQLSYAEIYVTVPDLNTGL